MNFRARLTYCDVDDVLLRVWGIVDRKRCEKINHILEINKDRLDESTVHPLSILSLKPGFVILVKQGLQFKRASIIRQVVPKKFRVRLIDVGNTVDVSMNDIRLPCAFPDLKELCEAPCAQDYILSNALVKDYTWSAKDLRIVNHALLRHPEAEFVALIGGKRLISVFISDSAGFMSLSSFLVQHKLAYDASLDVVKAAVLQRYNSYIPPTTVPQPKIPQPTLSKPFDLSDLFPPFSSLAVSQQAMNDRPVRNSPGSGGDPRSPPAAVSQSAIRAQQLEKPGVAPLPTICTQPLQVNPLPVGSQHEVHVSHVIDGPRSFMIQLKENLDSGKLQKLMEQLNDSSIHREPIELCYTGLMCLGRYSEDRQLRRAVVSKVLTDGADLLFIDFGNSETVPFSEIYRLPAQFFEQPVMALPFTLARVSTHPVFRTRKARQIFEELTQGANRLLLCVITPEVQAKQYCVLYICDNKGAKIDMKQEVFDKVKSARPVVYDRLTFKPNSSDDVFVPYVMSPIKFFIQLHSNQLLLFDLWDSLGEHYRASPTKDSLCIEDVHKNLAVCFDSPVSLKCRRGLVVGEPTDDGHVDVVDVDSGYEENIHFSRLRILNNGVFTKLPMQAVECRLDLDADFALREDVVSAFKCMVNVYCFEMKVISVLPENVLLVDLIDKVEDRSMKDALLSKFDVVKPVLPCASNPPESAASQKTGVESNRSHMTDNRRAEINEKQKVPDKVEVMKRVEYEKLSFKENNSHKVSVRCLESPIRFFVQLKAKQPFLEKLMKSFDEYRSHLPMKYFCSIEEVHENMAVLFPSPYTFTSRWLRGLTVGEPMDDGYVDVFDVDYGYVETMHFSTLCIINNGLFTKLPTQAVECRLDIDADFALKEEVITAFNNMASEYLCKTHTMKVIKVLPENVLLVDLFDEQGLSVKDKLLKLKKSLSPLASNTPKSATSHKVDSLSSETSASESPSSKTTESSSSKTSESSSPKTSESPSSKTSESSSSETSESSSSESSESSSSYSSASSVSDSEPLSSEAVDANTSEFAKKVSEGVERYGGTPIRDNQGAEINAKQEKPKNVELVKPAEYQRLSFVPSSSKAVLISHIKSPARFFVRLQANEFAFAKSKASISEAKSAMKSFSDIEEVHVNMAVLCQYRDKSEWLRGLIAEEPLGDGDVVVYYVDYGYKDIVHFSKLRTTNNEIISKLPMQAVECRLTLDAGYAVRIKVVKTFVHMANANYYKMKVTGVLPTNALYVDLWDEEGRNVKDMLLNKLGLKRDIRRDCDNQRAKIHAKQKMLVKTKLTIPAEFLRLSFAPNTRSLVHVFVSYVESPTRFFVQKKDDESHLALLTDGLQQYFGTSPMKNCLLDEDLKHNMAVYCRSPGDNKWNRGLIVGEPINDGNVSVFLLDYGSTISVPVRKLRIMDVNITSNLPVQAVECRLNIDAKFAITEEVINAFVHMADAISFKMKVIDVLPENVLLVDLFDEGDRNVKDVLLSKFGL